MNNKLTLKIFIILSFIVSSVIIIGLFSPWLIHKYNPYPVFNPETRMGELHYHSMIILSPFYVSQYEDGLLVHRAWFPSIGTVIAGLLILSVAIFSVWRFNKRFINFLILVNSFTGLGVFFLSLGLGVAIGWKNKVGGGLMLTVLGLFFAIVLSFIDVTQKKLPRFMDYQ